jgi:transposase-like protein
MKGKKHSPEQIVRKLQEADAMLTAGKTLGQVCQALEVSEQTFHRWRNQYGGMKAQEAKRLRELEDENRRLKKLLAEAESLLSGTAPRRALPRSSYLASDQPDERNSNPSGNTPVNDTFHHQLAGPYIRTSGSSGRRRTSFEKGRCFPRVLCFRLILASAF